MQRLAASLVRRSPGAISSSQLPKPSETLHLAKDRSHPVCTMVYQFFDDTHFLLDQSQFHNHKTARLAR